VLAGEVGAAELRDGVVAVLVEDLRVQPIGALQSDDAGPGIDRGGHLVLELVEKQSAKGFGRPRVAREERAFDRLRQIRQRKNVAVRVREVRRQPPLFVVGEGLWNRGRGEHAMIVVVSSPRCTRSSRTDSRSGSAIAIRSDTSTTPCT